jgi:hypothetical protein
MLFDKLRREFLWIQDGNTLVGFQIQQMRVSRDDAVCLAINDSSGPWGRLNLLTLMWNCNSSF